MISDGSVGTFCSKITLPASSTTHTDVSFTDTSKPTKCAISSLLPRCSRSPDLDPFIATEGDARSASKAEPQPPRYTILRGMKTSCCRAGRTPAIGSGNGPSPGRALTGEPRRQPAFARPRGNRRVRPAADTSIDANSLHLPKDFEDRTAYGRVGRSNRVQLREVAVVLEDRVGGAATGIAERLI